MREREREKLGERGWESRERETQRKRDRGTETERDWKTERQQGKTVKGAKRERLIHTQEQPLECCRSAPPILPALGGRGAPLRLNSKCPLCTGRHEDASRCELDSFGSVRGTRRSPGSQGPYGAVLLSPLPPLPTPTAPLPRSLSGAEPPQATPLFL